MADVLSIKQVEPTYRLGPHAHQQYVAIPGTPHPDIPFALHTDLYTIPHDMHRFRPSVVRDIAQQVLEDVLTGKAWENSEEAVWTVTITDTIKNKLKELDFPRYKYVVHVVLGEHRGQGVRVASRCLWDTNTDNMSTANFSNEQLWATATVFACYIE